MKYLWVIPPLLCLLLVSYSLSTIGILPPQLARMVPLTETWYKPLPQPGEYWSFIATKRGDPWQGTGSDLNQPAIVVLDVKDGWVRYCIGSIWDDERATLAIFLATHDPGMLNPEDAAKERIKYCQQKFAVMRKERE